MIDLDQDLQQPPSLDDYNNASISTYFRDRLNDTPWTARCVIGRALLNDEGDASFVSGKGRHIASRSTTRSKYVVDLSSTKMIKEDRTVTGPFLTLTLPQKSLCILVGQGEWSILTVSVTQQTDSSSDVSHESLSVHNPGIAPI